MDRSDPQRRQIGVVISPEWFIRHPFTYEIVGIITEFPNGKSKATVRRSDGKTVVCEWQPVYFGEARP